MTPNGAGGCTVKMCSVSQGTSADSGGTDMCDMYDLFCNSSEKNTENGVSCKPVKTDLQYTITSEQCGRYVGEMYMGHECQQANPTCLKTNTARPGVEALQAPEQAPVELGFQLYSICPPARNAAFNVHTMSQMEVTFQNSCAEVSAEIQARANGENGWVDPHND